MKTEMSNIDWEYVNLIFDNDTKEIQLFFIEYLALMSSNLKVLQLAIQNKNSKKVKEIFHFLKGSSGAVKKMYEYCIQGEYEVSSLNWEKVGLIYHKIDELFSVLKNEINNYVSK